MKRFVLILSSVVLFSVIGCGSSKQKVSNGTIAPPQKETAAVSGPVINVMETEIDQDTYSASYSINI